MLIYMMLRSSLLLQLRKQQNNTFLPTRNEMSSVYTKKAIRTNILDNVWISLLTNLINKMMFCVKSPFTSEWIKIIYLLLLGKRINHNPSSETEMKTSRLNLLYKQIRTYNRLTNKLFKNNSKRFQLLI